MDADVALARGKILHARFLDTGLEDAAELPLFERAAGLYWELGDARGEGESLFWVGTVHQVMTPDRESVVECARRGGCGGAE
ncbi:hypothetical protein [Micromonospora sp. NPDC050276]|uniref:hypothetical protein n=1 Tax=Micromonospora sp. NPDC050276 TaxID=3364278 RepID=UPI003798C386